MKIAFNQGVFKTNSTVLGALEIHYFAHERVFMTALEIIFTFTSTKQDFTDANKTSANVTSFSLLLTKQMLMKRVLT